MKVKNWLACALVAAFVIAASNAAARHENDEKKIDGGMGQRSRARSMS
jgi:hypothetical protein